VKVKKRRKKEIEKVQRTEEVIDTFLAAAGSTNFNWRD